MRYAMLTASGWIVAIVACAALGRALYNDSKATLTAITGRQIDVFNEPVILTQTSRTASLDQRYTAECEFGMPGTKGPACTLIVTDNVVRGDSPVIVLELVSRKPGGKSWNDGVLVKRHQLQWPQVPTDLRPDNVIGVPGPDDRQRRGIGAGAP